MRACQIVGLTREVDNELADEIQTAIDESRNPEVEVYNWWIVSDLLGRNLKAEGEIVAEVLGVTLWGNQSGGDLYERSLFERIAKNRGAR